MMGPRVRLTIKPGWGHIEAWGRDGAGAWFALIVWTGWLAKGFAAPSEVTCSAWVAAQFVQPVQAANYSRVARVALGDGWPSAAGAMDLGVRRDDAPLPAPDGMRWTVPRMKRR